MGFASLPLYEVDLGERSNNKVYEEKIEESSNKELTY